MWFAIFILKEFARNYEEFARNSFLADTFFRKIFAKILARLNLIAYLCHR